MKPIRWSPAALEKALATLRQHTSLERAVPAVAHAVGFGVTRDSLDKALRAAGHGSAYQHLRQEAPPPAIQVDWDEATEDTSPSIEAPKHDDLARLVALAKKYQRHGGLTLEALCDELRITPSQGRALAEKAIAAGYHVDYHEGALDFRPPDAQPLKEVHLDAPAVELGDEIAIGVVSDPHFASKHHERSALQRHVEWLYESGVRRILGPGDWVAGGYPFLKYEVTSNGIEDQCEEAVEFIQWAGDEMQWEGIAGNHDESHKVGIDAGKMIEQMLRSRGCTNFRYHGARGALLRLGHSRIAMHHPGGGLAYALSYKIQKYIDGMPLHERPHFLFTGHTHQKLWLERGGVNGFLCGTFENGDSSFGRMLGGEVQVGGWLVRYRHDEHGNVASVAPEFRKQPHRRMNYIQVPA